MAPVPWRPVRRVSSAAAGSRRASAVCRPGAPMWPQRAGSGKLGRAAGPAAHWAGRISSRHAAAASRRRRGAARGRAGQRDSAGAGPFATRRAGWRRRQRARRHRTARPGAPRPQPNTPRGLNRALKPPRAPRTPPPHPEGAPPETGAVGRHRGTARKAPRRPRGAADDFWNPTLMNQHRTRSRQRPPRPPWHALLLLLALLGPPPGARAMNATTAGPTCAGPYPLMLRTPACALKPPRRARPLPVRPCGPELCGLRGPGPNMLPARPPMDTPCDTPRTSGVAAHAAGSRVSASAPAHHGEAEKWWKKDADLWVDVHTEEEFEAAVTTGDRLVLVGGWRGAARGTRRAASRRAAPRRAARCGGAVPCRAGRGAGPRREGAGRGPRRPRGGRRSVGGGPELAAAPFLARAALSRARALTAPVAPPPRPRAPASPQTFSPPGATAASAPTPSSASSRATRSSRRRSSLSR
jgi:hypothetical protein